MATPIVWHEPSRHKQQRWKYTVLTCFCTWWKWKNQSEPWNASILGNEYHAYLGSSHIHKRNKIWRFTFEYLGIVGWASKKRNKTSCIYCHHINMNIYIYVKKMYICIYAYLHICIYVQICIHICAYIHVYIYEYICRHIGFSRARLTLGGFARQKCLAEVLGKSVWQDLPRVKKGWQKCLARISSRQKGLAKVLGKICLLLFVC